MTRKPTVHPRHARPARGRLSRQPHLRDAGAARPHHRRQRGAVRAPAHDGHDLRPRLRHAHAAPARTDRRGARQQRSPARGGRSMNTELRPQASRPPRSSSACSCCGNSSCRAFNVSDVVLPRPSQVFITLMADVARAVAAHAADALHHDARLRDRRRHRRRARRPHRLVEARLRCGLSAAGGFLVDPEGRRGADLGVCSSAPAPCRPSSPR